MMINLLTGILVGILVALAEGAYQLRKIHNVLDGISLLMYDQIDKANRSVGGEGEEMGEIEREGEERGDRQPQPARPLAQPDPTRRRDQKKPDAEEEVGETPEQDAVIEQQKREQ